MAVFSYLYYNNYIAKLASVSVGAVLNAVMQLDSKSQYELFSQLGNMLAAKRQIPGKGTLHSHPITLLLPIQLPSEVSGLNSSDMLSNCSR